MNIQGWFPLGLTGLILQSKGSQERDFSRTTVQKPHFFDTQLSLWSNSHICTWLLEKQNFEYMDICCHSDVCFSTLFFNTLTRFVIAFLPRSKLVAAVTVHIDFGAQENKICHLFHFYPFYLPWNEMGPATCCYFFFFLIWSFVSSYRKTQIYYCVKSQTWLSEWTERIVLEEGLGPSPWLHFYYYIAPPLFLHSIPSLICNYLTQARPRRLN